MGKPLLLDLFCKAGGAGMGYSHAGFEVMGVDIEQQPHYPFTFHQADAVEFLKMLIGNFLAWLNLSDISAIHASPPCQKYTKSAKQWRKNGKNYPDLIAEIRSLLVETGKPYVIENVPGSPLVNPVVLSGGLFGMNVHRDRLFECSFSIDQPELPLAGKPIKMGRPVKDGDIIQPVGHFSGVPYARLVMGLPWMNQGELAQAIPPAYTEFIGRHLLSTLPANNGVQPSCQAADVDPKPLQSSLWPVATG